jgi:hypothetical protein
MTEVEACSLLCGVGFSMSASDEQMEAGQRWRRTDGSGDELVLNSLIENDAGSDWDVTLLPSGSRVMRTAEFITRCYELV